MTGYQLADELCSRKDFVKFPSGAVAKLRDVMTQGLFTAHDDEWFWGPAHRVLVPAFGPMSIKKMFPGLFNLNRSLIRVAYSFQDSQRCMISRCKWL